MSAITNKPDNQRSEIWEKQPSETTRSYQLFLRYLDMDIRNMAELAKILTEEGRRITRNAISSTAIRYNWHERAAAYDEYQREIRLQKFWKDREKNQYQRIKILNQTLRKLEQAIENIDPHKIPTELIIHMLSQTNHMLRIEYGEESGNNSTKKLNTLEASATTIRVEFDNDSQLSFGDLGGDWEQYVPPGARRAPDTQQLPDELLNGHEKEQNGSMDNLVVE